MACQGSPLICVNDDFFDDSLAVTSTACACEESGAAVVPVSTETGRGKKRLLISLTFGAALVALAHHVHRSDTQGQDQPIPPNVSPSELQSDQSNDYIYGTQNGGANSSLLDLIDLDERAPCGRHKCFYKSKSNPALGFLVATRTHLEELEQGWEYGNCLTETYGVQHFMNDRPFTSRITLDMASSLNSVAFSFSPEIRPPTFIKESVVVQEMEAAPTPHMLIGCNKKKRKFIQSSYFDEFVRSVPNREEFMQRFDDSVRSMFDLLRAEPALMDDFQVILDTGGGMHYLDFSTSNALWAVNAFNTTTYKNNIASCSIMVRGVYEKMFPSKLDGVDSYLDGMSSEVHRQVKKAMSSTSARKKLARKNNACLPHLLPAQ
mmetsp:Transcript_19902/g.44367  ORF Transcript_19902/g.44367 Transcript_19902/m.44367 type:complete len:377 (+) Transcript_19902:146-1276(+)